MSMELINDLEYYLDEMASDVQHDAFPAAQKNFAAAAKIYEKIYELEPAVPEIDDIDMHFRNLRDTFKALQEKLAEITSAPNEEAQDLLADYKGDVLSNIANISELFDSEARLEYKRETANDEYVHRNSNFAVIKPIADLFEQAQADDNLVITFETLGELKQQVSRDLAAAQKEKNETRGIKNELYLEVLDLLVQDLKRNLDPEDDIGLEDLLESCDTALDAINANYHGFTNDLAHYNYFIGTGQYAAFDPVYDLYYINKQAQVLSEDGPVNNSHHINYNLALGSVFFARLEKIAKDTLLIGNIQVDANKAADWKNNKLGKVASSAAVINKNMVQEIIKHALSVGAKNIYFHAGDMMEIAQKGNPPMNPDLLPAEEIKSRHEWYERRLPELLVKKLKLKIKKVKLSNKGVTRDEIRVSHAWHVIGGLDKFQERPHRALLTCRQRVLPFGQNFDFIGLRRA